MIYTIGVMTGTSCDQVDAVVLAVEGDVLTTYAMASVAIEPELRCQIFQLCDAPHIALSQLLQVERAMAQLTVEAVSTVLQQAQLASDQVVALGVHGQTLYHAPQLDQGYTYQLADLSWIAAQTGIRTCGDFRRKDMAYGGQGAPLVPKFLQALVDSKQAVAFLNLGGIANIALLYPDQPVIGYDTGPANVLLDSWCQAHLHQPYDLDGTWAQSGQLQPQLLEQLLLHEYFQQSPPKSTGRDMFNLAWLNAHDLPDLPQDVQTTLSHLTAKSVALALSTHSPIKSLYVSGGGLHNLTLMAHLKHYLPQVNITSTDSLGIGPNEMEAAAFAYLAWCRINGQPGNVPSVTGANQATILGGVYEPG